MCNKIIECSTFNGENLKCISSAATVFDSPIAGCDTEI